MVCAAVALMTEFADAWPMPLPPRQVLTPQRPEKHTQAIEYSRMIVQADPTQSYVKLESGIFCRDVGERKVANYSEALRPSGTYKMLFDKQLGVAGLRSQGGGASNLFDAAPQSSADFEVGAVITDYKEEICDLGIYGAKAAARMDIQWQVYSKARSTVVAKIATSGGAKTGGNAAGVDALDQAFEQNVIGLLNSADFVASVSSPAGSSTEPQIAPAAAGQITVASRTPLSVPDSVASVVAVFSGDAMGSGWVVSEGYIMTDQHVVDNALKVRVRWSDGMETQGEVLRVDRRHDVALIKTDTRGRTPLAVRFEPLTPGETVFAIGTPLDPHFQNTVTRGVVSALHTFNGLPFIQSDVQVTHGNSGGPLLDEKGLVVGMTDWGFTPEGAPTGLNLFTPVRDAFDFLELKLEIKTAHN